MGYAPTAQMSEFDNGLFELFLSDFDTRTSGETSPLFEVSDAPPGGVIPPAV